MMMDYSRRPAFWGMIQAAWFAEEALSHDIIKAFFHVYNRLGTGFLESIYAAALERVLVGYGHTVNRETLVPVYFEGTIISYQRLDMVVDGKIIVELKATDVLHRDAHRQLRSYLKSTRLEVGLLLHFGSEPRFFRHAFKNI